MTASIDETIDPTVAARTRRVGTAPREGDAEVTDLERVRTDRLTSGQQRRAAARTRDLTALLRERPDLAGVHAPADFAVDGVLWCV
jgi:hypothetical protein